MKKTILTIMVAAMMLVAFTACEQAQMPTYRNVDYITIKQVADFVEGQPFDAANFQVIAHNTDNTETVIDGQGLVTIDTASGKSWENGDVVATLGTEKKLTAGYQVAFKKVTSVEFSGITSVTAAEGADITTMAGVKIDGSADATVALNYDGGSVTVPLTAISETVFNVFDGTTRVTKAGKEGDVYDVYIVDRYQFAGEDEVPVTAPIATNLELKVVAKGAATTFDHYTANPISNTAENTYFGDKYQWRLAAVATDDTELGAWGLDTFTNGFEVISMVYTDAPAGTAAPTQIPTAYGQYTVKVTAIEKAHPERGVQTFTFPSGPNYISDVKGVTSFATGVTKAQVEAKTITANQLVYNVTKANTTDTTTNLDTSKVQILDQQISGSNWTAKIVVYYGKGNTTAKLISNVSLQVPTT